MDKQSSYILMISWLPTLISILFMFVIRIHPTVEDGHKTLDLFSAVAMILASYLMAVIILQNVLTLGTSSNLIICIFLFVILLFPMAIAIKSELWHSSIIPHYSEPLLIQENHPREEIQKPRVPERTTGVEILNVDFQDETDSASKQSIHLLHGSSVYSKIPEDENAGASAQPLSNDLMSSPLDRGDNFNLFQAMRTLDFWILFLSMACGMGSGLTTINNMSQIGSSLDYTSTEIDTLVSLWSIWNFLGRFGAGYVSETFLHSKGYARPLFIAIALLVMSGGHLVIASGLPGALYAGSVLIGVCYGSQWSLMPATTSEIFGLQHFGTLFNTIAIASPIGSYILSVKVVGYLYDYEAEKEHHLENTHTIDLILSSEETCDGSHCFRVAFMIMCAVSLLGWFVASVLFLRTRRFYKQGNLNSLSKEIYQGLWNFVIEALRFSLNYTEILSCNIWFTSNY
eukprot:Gb_03908 [translate_table: standard]